MKVKLSIFVILIAGFLCCLTNSLSAQWKKLFDFGADINTIYFMEFTPIPQDGFISLWHNLPSHTDELWRTLDGGRSWQQTTYDVPGALANSFTFKNSMEGWWGKFGSNGIFKTLDGGNTWTFIPSLYGGNVFYVPLTGRLL